MSVRLPKVCIIGGGSSGIATAKVFHERGIPFDCFEASDRVGGNWVFGNKNGMSAAYQTLHINTSRDRMAYSDYPMPPEYPDFPHHSQIAEYFESYVDHFGFREHITFNTYVEHCHRRESGEGEGCWEVTIRSRRYQNDDSWEEGPAETRFYDALVVANGHHWDQRWPDPPFPGHFDGTVIHSHSYRDGDFMRNKRVLVLGMGNSAMDIVKEASQVGKKAFLAARRGAYVLPKYLLGRPIDTFPMSPYMPWRVRQRLLATLIKIVVGKMETYGLPEPQHKLLEAHPTVSDHLLSLVAHGAIVPKPNIESLLGDRVRFTDGTEEQVDIIVYCTGYKVTFPFLAPDFLDVPENDLPLFRRVFKPGVDNLFFIGLLQPLGAIMPLAELQSQWAADYLEGTYHLPPPTAVATDMARERALMFKRYLASPRHTMQVDFEGYVLGLRRERKRGGRRAAKNGCSAPVTPVAHTLQPLPQSLSLMPTPPENTSPGVG